MSTLPTSEQLDSVQEQVNAMIDTAMQRKVPGNKMHDIGRMKKMTSKAVGDMKLAIAAGTMNDAGEWLADHVSQRLAEVAAMEGPDMAQRESQRDREDGKRYYDSQKVELKFVTHCIAEKLGIRDAYMAACSHSAVYEASGR